ncbi:hypothetical protein GGR58DRAFT_523622 [Xylaria digitata]|nr:hypothetical protein GGR58DRAFT_523622 [Xylaria digitata]
MDNAVDHLVLDTSTEYHWPGALSPRQLYGYHRTKALYMFLRVAINSALIGVLVYAIVALAAFENIPVKYDACLASSASWLESRFFINVVVREDLSFTQAKLIDLAWDTFIGQGLRFLHAWWLYQVATHVATCCLETSGLIYDFLLTVLLRTASFSSLIATLRVASGKNWKNCRLYCAWLAFAIGYILVFPTIWAASAGYASPSITVYNLSNKAYVSIKSENLTLCWVNNDIRLSGYLDSVVPGPSFYSLYGFDENHVPSPSTPWKLPYHPSDFNNIFFYAKTKHSLQDYFHSFNTSNSGNFSNIINSTVQLQASFRNGMANWTGPAVYIDEAWDGLFFYTNKSMRDNWNSPGLLQVLLVSQFSRASDLFGPGVVPYNSTLELENNVINLPASFLTFGVGDVDCLWWNSSTGECPCYMGKALEAGWAIANQHSCIGATGYIWGFSSFILPVAVILEIIWIIGCWLTRWHTTVSSNLIEYNRRSVGTIRHILDLAEAINRDLGPNTSTYTEYELQDALWKCPPVGYEIESREGLKHIRLVTVHRGCRWRKKIDINFDDIYR